MTDERDPYKAEIKAETKQEVMQDLHYRAHLSETQRQAEEYYFGQFPHHREARPMVMEEAAALLRERPEYNTLGQPKEKIDEAVRTLGQRVDERLSRATTPQREERSEAASWRNFGQPSDQDRAEAMDEDQQRYLKMRRR